MSCSTDPQQTAAASQAFTEVAANYCQFQFAALPQHTKQSKEGKEKRERNWSSLIQSFSYSISMFRKAIQTFLFFQAENKGKFHFTGEMLLHQCFANGGRGVCVCVNSAGGHKLAWGWEEERESALGQQNVLFYPRSPLCVWKVLCTPYTRGQCRAQAAVWLRSLDGYPMLPGSSWQVIGTVALMFTVN